MKLLDKAKRIPKSEVKRPQYTIPINETTSSKIEKLEILNNLLIKKNSLLEVKSQKDFL